MKKTISILLSLMLALVLSFSLAGCGKKYEGKIEIYMPDGAPALAFSQLMSENNTFDRDVTYHVVDANTIGTYVANETAAAALIPVNAATKLAGTGEKYKMLSVNTHGNLFVVGKQEAADVNALKGKKIGVVNLANVPGLTFKAILSDKGIAYTEDADALTAENVYLVNIAGTEIAARLNADGAAALDFVVAPEPAVSTITGKVPAIKVRLSLQELWGEGGYPQAVLLAKTELTEDKDFVNDLLDALTTSAEWLPTHATEAAEAVKNHLTEGLNPSFTADNLTQTVITNCNIKVEKAKDAKEKVKSYIDKIMAIDAQSTSAPADAFFYM